MKVLIIDNNPRNRQVMNEMMHEQGVIFVSGVLEAPNRIMGSMLIEAIDFDLVIIGGGLSNILPDGSHDEGDGVSLIKQLLKKNSMANVVLWSDKTVLQVEFQAVLMAHKSQAPEYFCWRKHLLLAELEKNLLLIFSLSRQPFSTSAGSSLTLN